MGSDGLVVGEQQAWPPWPPPPGMPGRALILYSSRPEDCAAAAGGGAAAAGAAAAAGGGGADALAHPSLGEVFRAGACGLARASAPADSAASPSALAAAEMQELMAPPAASDKDAKVRATLRTRPNILSRSPPRSPLSRSRARLALAAALATLSPPRSPPSDALS